MVARALDHSVRQFIVPAYDAGSLERTRQVASAQPDALFPAYGIHPWYVDDSTDVNTLIRPYLTDKDIVAIGEIGLDFVPGCPPTDLQTRVFRSQIDLAMDLDLPVIIHCRRAHEQLYSMLKGYRGSVKGVMHSYSGSTELMFRFMDLGLFIAFAGSVTRRTARKYHKNAREVPLDRLLLETDAPSIATETTVASLVEPRHIVEVAQKVADLRGIAYDDVCRQSTENAGLLFRLPEPVT